MDAEKTGKLIRMARIEKEITQRELAERIHVSNAAVSKWENGHGFPDISSLEGLAEVLGISITELIQGEKIQEDKKKDDTVVKEIIQLSEKEIMKKVKTQNTLLSIFIGGLSIVGFSFIFYMMSTQNKPVLDFTQSTGILTIAPLALGIMAWIFAGIVYFRGNKMEPGKPEWMHALSFACCAIALWFPILEMDLQIREEDIVFVLDTVWGYNFASMVLLLTTVLVNALAYRRTYFS
ncbi:MAG: helix-turn-helix domain-containing protein [Lachnospiraceae bacterium]|nr:helix-turn-helix domain-containing protein [Lachnospiraceae bacterium]